MATAVKKRKGTNHTTKLYTAAKRSATKIKLPRSVTKQLEKIYFQSRKKVKKHPYQVAGGVLLSLGLASGTYFLVRMLRNQY